MNQIKDVPAQLFEGFAGTTPAAALEVYIQQHNKFEIAYTEACKTWRSRFRPANDSNVPFEILLTKLGVEFNRSETKFSLCADSFTRLVKFEDEEQIFATYRLLVINASNIKIHSRNNATVQTAGIFDKIGETIGNLNPFKIVVDWIYNSILKILFFLLLTVILPCLFACILCYCVVPKVGALLFLIPARNAFMNLFCCCCRCLGSTAQNLTQSMMSLAAPIAPVTPAPPVAPAPSTPLIVEIPPSSHNSRRGSTFSRLNALLRGEDEDYARISNGHELVPLVHTA